MTDLARYIIVPRWDGPDGFQHYKGREPIWIKNYTRLLNDDDYLNLTFRQRGLLHSIWLAYARGGRVLGSSVADLGRILGEPSVRTRDLEALNHAGFLTFSASKPLATRYQDASPELERDKKDLRARARKGQTTTGTACPICTVDHGYDHRLVEHLDNLHYQRVPEIEQTLTDIGWPLDRIEAAIRKAGYAPAGDTE